MGNRSAGSSIEALLIRLRRHPAVIVITLSLGALIGVATLLNSFTSISAFFNDHAAAERAVRSSAASSDVRKVVRRAPISPSEPLAGSNFPGVSAKDVLSTLSDESLTDLQRAQFMERTSGEMVEWTGVVRSVTAEWKGQKDSPIFVVFVPYSTSASAFPKIVVASFPSSSKADLSALSNGDEVTIVGRLKYIDAVEPSPALYECRLVTFSHK